VWQVVQVSGAIRSPCGLSWQSVHVACGRPLNCPLLLAARQRPKVTRVARDLRVRAFEREVGARMIELADRPARGRVALEAGRRLEPLGVWILVARIAVVVRDRA
jgi:hypothetical protein